MRRNNQITAIEEESLRCGRCASLLPDETLSYCPACGVVFSDAPPTTSYITIESHKLEKAHKQKTLKILAASTTALIMGFLLTFSGFELHRQAQLRTVKTQRSLHVFIKQDPTYPMMNTLEIQQAIPIGLQSFQDHFGLTISQIKIEMDQMPEEVSDLIEKQPYQAQEGLFWATAVHKYFSPQWIKKPYQPLNVVITNIPIRATPETREVLETAHLGSNHLISGLGDPSLVLITTYRLMTEFHHFSSEERTRFLGEYVLAHELGHALLGLKDYMVEDNHAIGLRAPASTQTPSECLMHTDTGGGKKAWASLKNRNLGEKSQCTNYNDVLESHTLRNLSWQAYRAGKTQEAIELMKGALTHYEDHITRTGLNPMYLKLWKHELNLMSRIF